VALLNTFRKVIYFNNKKLLILDNALILCLQAFRVDELVSKCKTASFAGAELMEHLQNATIYIHSGLIYFLKIMVNYLMHHFIV
jgi:hypothetical protein